jgi:hypothetical protein
MPIHDGAKRRATRILGQREVGVTSVHGPNSDFVPLTRFCDCPDDRACFRILSEAELSSGHNVRLPDLCRENLAPASFDVLSVY